MRTLTLVLADVPDLPGGMCFSVTRRFPARELETYPATDFHLLLARTIRDMEEQLTADIKKARETLVEQLNVMSGPPRENWGNVPVVKPDERAPIGGEDPSAIKPRSELEKLHGPEPDPSLTETFYHRPKCGCGTRPSAAELARRREADSDAGPSTLHNE